MYKLISDQLLAVSFSPLEQRGKKLQSVTGCECALTMTVNVSNTALPVWNNKTSVQIIQSEWDCHAHSGVLVRAVTPCQRIQWHPIEDDRYSHIVSSTERNGWPVMNRTSRIKPVGTLNPYPYVCNTSVHPLMFWCRSAVQYAAGGGVSLFNVTLYHCRYVTLVP
jgi:hypothetical protein